MSSFEIRIYNRWGELVFVSFDPNFCWDGTYKGQFQEPGVYVFILSANVINRGEINKTGNVTLIK